MWSVWICVTYKEIAIKLIFQQQIYQRWVLSWNQMLWHRWIGWNQCLVTLFHELTTTTSKTFWRRSCRIFTELHQKSDAIVSAALPMNNVPWCKMRWRENKWHIWQVVRIHRFWWARQFCWSRVSLNSQMTLFTNEMTYKWQLLEKLWWIPSKIFPLFFCYYKQWAFVA